MLAPSTGNLEKVIRHLSETIGPRLAGSVKEREAALYMQENFRALGLDCRLENFPVLERRVESEKLELFIDGAWKSYGCSLYGGAPSTDGKTVEGEVVFFDSHTDFQREDLSYLSGKAVLYYGVNFPSGNDYRRMMEARPAFLMMVDTRFVSARTLADGLYPAYVKAFGALPCVSVAAFDSWEWVQKKASKARLCVAGGAFPSQSCNVVAELPGDAPDGKIIYFGSHLDTQANCPGADDNAAACALVLEFARILRETRHKRTIRFLSFGAEEQLSVGSCAYLAAHKEEIARGGFCFNFDESGTAVGWTVLRVSAPEALREKIRAVFHARGIYYLENRTPKPFNDFFPFSASGIGGFSGERYNCETKLDYHHSRDDVIGKLSMEILADFAGATAEIAAFLADAEDVFPYLGVDPDYADEVRARWEETFLGKGI